jgi:hypothetical protein
MLAQNPAVVLAASARPLCNVCQIACTDRALIYGERRACDRSWASTPAITTGTARTSTASKRPPGHDGQASPPPDLPVQRRKVLGGVVSEK